jgi:hypothetical protein
MSNRSADFTHKGLEDDEREVDPDGSDPEATPFDGTAEDTKDDEDAARD